MSDEEEIIYEEDIILEEIDEIIYERDDGEGDIMYTGYMKNGKPHGKGKYEQGYGYEQAYGFDITCKKIGYVTYETVEIDDEGYSVKYDGEFKDGKKHGYGEMICVFTVGRYRKCRGEDAYGRIRGHWKNNKMHGEMNVYRPTSIDRDQVPDKHGNKTYSDPYFVEVNYENITEYYYDGEIVDKEYKELKDELKIKDVNQFFYKDQKISETKYKELLSELKVQTIKEYYYRNQKVSKSDYKDLDKNWLKRLESKREKNTLSTVLDKTVALGTKQDISEILNSVGY